VRLLLQHDNNISLHHVGNLLALSLEHDSFAIGGALDYVSSQGFLVVNDLTATTRRTVLLIHAALALTLVARLLHLHLHEAEVLHNFDDAATLALIARLGLATLGT